ncbi:MAG: sensory rhodopsin transducer, partial [Armatimonadetes bacterium]|nr:sensory rhodopsin transducer [Armatimonadota bacterium]
MADGRLVWIFPDGDLPPRGEDGLPLEGHESLIVLNTGNADAHLAMGLYFS